MMSRSVLLILLSGMLFAGDVVAASGPHWTVGYKVVNLIFNVDSFLEASAELRPLRCHYKSFVTTAENDYQGLGACLYQSLVDGFNTNKIPGVITARLQMLPSHKPITVTIAWRSPRGGFWHTGKKLYRDWKKEPDIGERESLLGTIVFNVSLLEPDDLIYLMGKIKDKVPDVLGTYLAHVAEQVSDIRIMSTPLAGDEIQTHNVIEIDFHAKYKPYKFFLDWPFFVIPPQWKILPIDIETLK